MCRVEDWYPVGRIPTRNITTEAHLFSFIDKPSTHIYKICCTLMDKQKLSFGDYQCARWLKHKYS
jgi:hypothetical protein